MRYSTRDRKGAPQVVANSITLVGCGIAIDGKSVNRRLPRECNTARLLQIRTAKFVSRARILIVNSSRKAALTVIVVVLATVTFILVYSLQGSNASWVESNAAGRDCPEVPARWDCEPVGGVWRLRRSGFTSRRWAIRLRGVGQWGRSPSSYPASETSTPCDSGRNCARLAKNAGYGRLDRLPRREGAAFPQVACRRVFPETSTPRDFGRNRTRAAKNKGYGRLNGTRRKNDQVSLFNPALCKCARYE